MSLTCSKCQRVALNIEQAWDNGWVVDTIEVGRGKRLSYMCPECVTDEADEASK